MQLTLETAQQLSLADWQAVIAKLGGTITTIELHLKDEPHDPTFAPQFRVHFHLGYQDRWMLHVDEGRIYTYHKDGLNSSLAVENMLVALHGAFESCTLHYLGILAPEPAEKGGEA